MQLIIGNHNYSSWSLRAWLLLRQFNLDFDTTRVPLYQGDFSQHIQKYSKAARVPVLIDNGLTIWDSLSIAEYTNEQHLNGKGWPEDRILRAHARSSCAEMHSGFFDLREQMPMNCRRIVDNFSISDATQKDIDRICQLWEEALQLSGSESFLYGEFSIADAFFAPVIFRFNSYGVALSPRLQAYKERVLALPACQEWLELAREETEVIEEEEV